MTESKEKSIWNYYEGLGKRFIYNSTGLPFNGRLPKSINDQRSRIKKKKASMIIIDGGVGEGKTTLAYHVAEFFQEKIMNHVVQYAMGGEEFTKKVKLCIKNNKIVVIYDEAGDFNRRGFATRLNRMLNRLFEIYRGFQILVIIILPNFNVLDSQLFDNRIPRLLLHVHNRNEKYGNIKIYGLWRMLWLRNWMTKLAVKSDAYKIVKCNYKARFKNLPANREKKLDKISCANKYQELHVIDIKNRQLLSYKDLAQQVGKSVTWCKQKINILEIKEKEIFKKKKYFHKSAIRILEKSMEN